MKKRFRLYAEERTWYKFDFEVEIPDDYSEDDIQDLAFDEANTLALQKGPHDWEYEIFEVTEVK